jgi:hypothetical protein
LIRAGIVALTAVAVSILTLAPVYADDPVVVDLQIDAPDVVTVGDRVGYKIVVEVDEGTGVALAAAGLPVDVALVDSPQTDRTPLGDGREQVTLSFQLAPFVTGDVTVPPIPLRYTNPDGSTGDIQTAASAIQVSSVLPANGQVAPRGLKPQAEVGTPPPTWPVPVAAGIAAAVALLVIGFFVRRRLARRRTTQAQQTIPVYTGPEDLARQALDKAGAEFAASGDFVAYYTAIGNVMRRYLTQRYEFPAFALTTRELEAEMARLGINRWQVRVASGLMEQCDSVIYARYRPAAERADADLTAAYEVVEMSRPESADSGAREEVAVS